MHANVRFLQVLAASAAICGAMPARALETAESLIVDLDMTSVGATTDGAPIGAWNNKAPNSSVGNFVPVTSGAGGVYSATGAGGVPAVYFNGSASGVMWESGTLPETMTGNNSWSVEVWVFNPETEKNNETVFSWTYRGGSHKCLEMRYGSDAGNAVEHYNDNTGWQGGVPMVGMWHHIAVARDDASHEVLYLDGVKNNEVNVTMEIPTTGNFYIGAARNGSSTGDFPGDYVFSGYVAAVRVHSGTLSATQVAANYNAERGIYQNCWKGNDGLWSDASEWSNGAVPTVSARFADGGTATIAGDVSLKDLKVINGAVKVDGGSLALVAGKTASIGAGGGAASLEIASGSFSANDRLDVLSGGGTLAMTMGAPGAPEGTASATMREFNMSFGGEATLTMKEGATLTVNGWCRGAFGNAPEPAVAHLVIDGGTMLCNDWFIIATDGASGDLTIKDGLFRCPGFEFTYAGNSDTQSAVVNLNGGTLELNYFQNASPSGTQAIYFNGGVLKARQSNGNFLPDNLDACVVKSGGAYIDVPGEFAVDVKSAFSVDPQSTGGAIVKTGTGRINFAQNFDFDGPIAIEAGSVKFVGRKNLSHVTSISLAEGAAVLCTEAGGVADILALLPADCAGTVLIASENAADDVDLTGHPNVKVGFSSTFDYTGTITYDPSATPVISFVQNQAAVTVNNVLADQGGKATRLEVSGLPGRNHKLVLNQANTFTGGIVVNNAMLQFDNAAASGSGPIRLVNGELVLNNSGIDVSSLVARITADSVGSLVFCSDGPKDQSFSLAGLPGIYLGSYYQHNVTYTGTITFDGDECHFGGGDYPYDQSNGTGFWYQPAAGIADGTTPVKVVGGRLGLFGLATAGTFTGGVIVTNEAAIFIQDNEAAWGEPATTKADYFYFNGGNLRGGNASETFGEKLGVTVGPDGMKAHIWSNTRHTFEGGLHGTGPVLLTDIGILAFGGSGNDYSGEFTIGDNAVLQIGSDSGFSWNFAQSTFRMNNAGSKLILYVKDGAVQDFPESLNGGVLAKDGAGLLTVSAAQATAGTVVSGGTLAVDADGILSGSLTVEAGCTLEIRNNATVHVGALAGAGTIAAPEGTAATLVVTGGNFSGTVASNVTIVKEGTDRCELHFPGRECCNVEVRQGTLAVEASGIGRPVVADGAVLELISGGQGLTGYYYADANSYNGWDSSIGSLAGMAAFEASRSPTTIQNSTAFGSVFNVHDNNGLFPAGLGDKDYWVAIWRGRIWIDEPGVYGFGTASDDGSSVHIDGKSVVQNLAYQGWGEGQFEAHYGECTLERGWHDIVIGFFEGTGGNNITVRIKKPGASAMVDLPMSMLFDNSTYVVPTISDISEIQGRVVMGGGSGSMTFDVPEGETIDPSSYFDMGSTAGDVVKTGDGTLEYGVRGAFTPARFDVEDGTVAFNEATSVGELYIGADGKVSVSAKKTDGYRGLSLRIYNTDDNDGTFRAFETMSGITTLFEETLTPAWSGNTWFFGWDALSAAMWQSSMGNGYRFPMNYGASSVDRFNTYMTGTIRLPCDGEYAFAFYSDDGVSLFIDGERYYYLNGCAGGTGSNGGWKRYSAGFHTFTFGWREQGGGQHVSVYIRSQNSPAPWGDWALLPQALLYPELTYVKGLSGSGELDLTSGELWVEQEAPRTFSGALKGGAGAWLAKDGSEPLTLSGDLSGYAGGLAVVKGNLVLSPSADVEFGSGISVESGATLTIDGARAVTLKGPLTGSGTVVVNGGATFAVARSEHFTGEVKVRDGRFVADSDSGAPGQEYVMKPGDSGEMVVSAGRADLVTDRGVQSADYANMRYYRVTFKRTRGNSPMQISELALYDQDFVRLNLNLADAGNGKAATELAPGQFSSGAAYDFGGNGSEGMANIFDGNTGTKMFIGGEMNDASVSSKWRVVTMRLADSAHPVRYYSFFSANDSMDRTPSDWTLESSPDGVTWTLLDTRTGWTSDPREYFEESTRFSHAQTDAIAFPTKVTASTGAQAVVAGSADVVLDGGAATLTGLSRLAATSHANWTFNQQAQPEYDALGENGFWILFGDANAAGSTFLSERVDVRNPWRVTYKFKARKGVASDSWADGVAFCIHNESDGAAFCDKSQNGGALGGVRGTGHPTCAGFWINLFGKENCGWAFRGSDMVSADICSTDNRWSADGYDIEVSYDGRSLLARVWHLGTLVASLAQEIDMAAVVGGGDANWDGKAYLGFLGATGGSAVNVYLRDTRVYLTPSAAPVLGASVTVAANGTGTLEAFNDGYAFDVLNLGAGAALSIAADADMKAANFDYAVTAGQLVSDGASSIAIADNGTGKGTLLIGGIVAGGPTTVSGGRVGALNGALEVVVPDSVPDGMIELLKYGDSEWTGDEPQITLTGASETDTRYRKFKAFFRTGRIFISNRSGFAFLVN